MKTQPFPSQAKRKILFALHCHYNGDTQYRVWFDLGNSLTRWKRIFFNFLKNSQFAKFAKFRMRTQLFPRHALPKIFLLYTVITLVILNAVFGFIWSTPWPDKKDLFLKFLFREIQKFLYENPTFFLVKLNEKYFLLYTAITMVILNTEFGLIWATPWPDEKQLFLKFSKNRNSRNSQSSVWKTIFLLGKLYQQLFCFTLSLHWW